MGTIGFGLSEPKKGPDRLPDGEALLRFDSGRAISFEDSVRHIGVWGASGGGKTTCTITPALDAAVKHFDTLCILDPKGTLIEKVLGAALKHNRERDVIIIGTHPAAQPLNLIEGMEPNHFYTFVMEIFDRFTCGSKSGNMDFHASAISTARDIYHVLKMTAELSRAQESHHSDPAKNAPTLQLVLDLLTDCREATKIFQELVKVAPETPDFKRFVKRIKGLLFHSLNQVKDSSDYDRDHEQQVAYHTGGAIRCLSGFLEEPGIKEKFCFPGKPGLNFDDYEGKICLLSFMPGSGSSAASVCRLVIESFYAWVYRQGVGGKRKLIIGDEYQEYADLSPRRLADPGFLAMAREFNCSVFLATQSYSGLAAKNGVAGLDALAANLNTKIFLHSEDPLTREAARALGSPDLIDLQRQCYAVSYDTRTREYVYGLETMDEAYKKGHSIPAVRPASIQFETPEHPVEDITAAVEWLVAEKKRLQREAELQETLKKTEEKIEEKPVEKPAEKPAEKEESNCLQKLREKVKMSRDHYYNTLEESSDFPSFEYDDEDEKPVFPPDDLRTLYSKNFVQNAEVQVPKGFMTFVRNAFDLMDSMNLKILMRYIGLTSAKQGSVLEAVGHPSGNINYLNDILLATRSICAKCGCEIKPNNLNLCPKCLESFPGMAARQPKKEMPHE